MWAMCMLTALVYLIEFVLLKIKIYFLQYWVQLRLESKQGIAHFRVNAAFSYYREEASSACS